MQLNKELILGLSESNNVEFVNSINELVNSLLFNAVKEVSQKSPFVKLESCCLQASNESLTGAVTQSSEFTYLLGIENEQIELNSRSKKNIWKYIWREFRASWRLGKKKYKKSRSGK